MFCEQEIGGGGESQFALLPLYDEFLCYVVTGQNYLECQIKTIQRFNNLITKLFAVKYINEKY